MKIAKRIITVVGAPALLAGFMLAGSAAATPALAGPSMPYTVTFKADVILANTTASLDSTSCTLTGSGGTAHKCFLGGAATIGPPPSGTLSLTSTNGSFQPVTLNLTEETANCADGTALAITPTGTKTVNAKLVLNNRVIQTGANTYTVGGTIKIGPDVGHC